MARPVTITEDEIKVEQLLINQAVASIKTPRDMARIQASMTLDKLIDEGETPKTIKEDVNKKLGGVFYE